MTALEPLALAGAAAASAVAGVASMRRRVKTATVVVDESRARFRMLARTLAHDLSAPLRGISQNTDRLMRCVDSGDLIGAKRWADRVKGSVAELDQRVRSLSDFFHKSNVTADKLRQVSLKQAIAEARSQVPRGLAVTVTGATSTEVPQVIGHVIGNLLSNAKRYASPNALPRADVQITRPGLAILRIAVSDNGIGFDPAKAEEIFEPFRRLDPNVGNGTGIGLSIVQHIVDQLGGSIRAESEGFGHGATFILELPCAS